MRQIHLPLTDGLCSIFIFTALQLHTHMCAQMNNMHACIYTYSNYIFADFQEEGKSSHAYGSPLKKLKQCNRLFVGNKTP